MCYVERIKKSSVLLKGYDVFNCSHILICVITSNGLDPNLYILNADILLQICVMYSFAYVK